MLGLLGWIVLISATTVLLDKFWEEISNWLNHTAADVVERVLGYNAKKFMNRAVVKIGRIREIIHNTAIVYTKKQAMDSFYEKVTYETDAPVYKIDSKVIEEIKKQGELVQTFEYKN